MSTIIKFELKELRKLATDKESCVVEKKVTQNLALQPWCLGNLKESIKNLLDYKIGKYDKEFNGILLSYKNLHILQNVGSIKNDNADIHFQVQADYYIFCPHVGATLKGVVNKKCPTHLGILVHRVFNVVIPRPTEEPDKTWIGSSLQEGQHVVFRIVVLDLYGALPYIRGEIDERQLKLSAEEDDEELKSNTVRALDVSYVNFDKMKPYMQRQIGDGLPPTSSKTIPRNNSKNVDASKQQLKNASVVDMKKHNMKIVHSKPTPEKGRNMESYTSIIEKNKPKRQSKILEIDAKQSESNPKTTKKHKKDV